MSNSTPRSLGLLTFAVISFLWFAKTWVDPLHRHAGVIGDPDSYIFALAWPPFAVAHHMNPFYSTYLLAPKGANLMWTIPPGFGLMLWPVTAVVGPILTYNLLATLSLAFSAWTAQLALRRFVPGELGPFVGGLFYGFSPYMAAHSIAHTMLTVAILPPLLLLLLHEALVRQRWKPGVTGLAIGALLAFQLSTFLEMLAGGAVAGASLTIVLAIMYRRQVRDRFRYFAIAVASGVVAFLVLGGVQLWTLVLGERNLLHIHDFLHPPNLGVNDLFGFVVPSNFQSFAPSALRGISNHFSTGGAEVNGYIGVPLLLICIVIAVKHWRSPTVRVRVDHDGRDGDPLDGAAPADQGAVDHPAPVGSHRPAAVDGQPAAGSPLGLHRPRHRALARVRHRSSRAPGDAGAERRPVRRGRGGSDHAGAVVVPAQIDLRAGGYPALLHVVGSEDDSEGIDRALVAPWTTDPSNIPPEVWQSVAHFRFKLPSGYAYVPLAGAR